MLSTTRFQVTSHVPIGFYGEAFESETERFLRLTVLYLKNLCLPQHGEHTASVLCKNEMP